MKHEGHFNQEVPIFSLLFELREENEKWLCRRCSRVKPFIISLHFQCRIQTSIH